jgi:hypothetical protein
MRQSTAFLVVAFLSVFLSTAVAATAQVVVYAEPDITISTGYSNLQTQKANNLFYDHSGPYLDADFAWTLPLVVPVQLGFGATGSGYWDRQSVFTPASENFYYPYEHLNSDVGLFELEPRAGVHFGGQTGLYAVPRIGAGLLIDSYSIDQSTTNNGNTYFFTRNHSGAAFEVRPAIQVGYSWGYISAGVEGSYLYSWGDFGGLGHNAQEYRIGAFVTFKF